MSLDLRKVNRKFGHQLDVETEEPRKAINLARRKEGTSHLEHRLLLIRVCFPFYLLNMHVFNIRIFGSGTAEHNVVLFIHEKLNLFRIAHSNVLIEKMCC